MSPYDASKLREMFPALRDATWAAEERAEGAPAVPVFFDAPGGVQVPGSVIDAISHYLIHANANSGGIFATSKRTNETISSARAAMADYLGSLDPSTIVLGANMTTLTFHMSRTIARSQGWTSGDEIVLTQLDHDANVSPWLQVARDLGMTVKYVPLIAPECILDLSKLPGLLTERTKLVAVTYASNAVGTINPVKEIAQTVHEQSKALIYVDAVAYAPHGAIDVVDLDVDFLVCSAYKFFGPHVGVLYGKKGLLDSLEAYKVRPAPKTAPGRFETGTGLFELFAGVTAAVDYVASVPELLGAPLPGTPTRRQKILQAWKLITAHEAELSHQLISGLLQVPGIKFYGLVASSPEGYIGKRAPTVSFTLDSHPAEEISKYLATKNVCAWSGNFYAYEVSVALGREGNGGMLRLGCVHYSTKEEVAYVLECLKELVAGKVDGSA